MSDYKPPYSITSQMLKLSTAISEELTKIEYSKDMIITPFLRKKNRIKTLAGTLEIEGNFLGEENITAILDGKKVLGTMQEVSEVEGAIKAYKELGEYQFDEMDDLLKAHKFLMKGILKTAGCFRTVNVGVGKHIAPPSKRVPKLMSDVFNWLQDSNEHLLIKSCVFHYEVEFIHPFSDGNGRIGRLWQTVILHHWKEVFSVMPIESIIRDNQQKYYDVLEESGAIGDSNVFVEFMLELLLQTIIKVGNEVGNRVGNKLTENQLQIIANIRLDSKISAGLLVDKVGISKRKIEENISKLKKMNIIIRVGGTRGHWEIVD